MRTPYPILLPMLAAAPALSAQEPRSAPRIEADSLRLVGPESRFQVLTTRRARLGISVNMRARESDSVGAYVQSVTPNGPAARAGLQSGDIVTRMNGKPLVGDGFKVGNEQSAPGMRLIELAALLEAGDTVRLDVRRGKEKRTVSVIAGDEPVMTWSTTYGARGFVFGDNPEAIAEALRRSEEGLERSYRMERRHDGPPMVMERTPMPPRMMFLAGGPLAELELAPMNVELGRYFGTSEGVLVIRAPADSKLSLKGGDVVLAVDGRTVASPAHLIRVLRSYGESERFRIDLMRMKKRETVQGVVAE